MSLVAIFVVLNIITAIKTENLEAAKEIPRDVDQTENNNVLAILKNDAEDSAKIENFIPSPKIKRSAVEENEVSLKPIRRVRHRGNLKQDLKAGEVSVNTSVQSDLRSEEVTKSIKSNTNTFEDRGDNATNKTNIALNNNLINTYLDINRDLLMRTMELNRLSNRNITLLNNQPISSIVQNENMKSKGIIEMPSKYISVVKDPNTIIMPNANDEIASFDNRTPKEEVIKTHNTEILSEQYDQEPYLLNKKPLKTNENVYQNLLNAKRLYGHIENKEINDAGFVLGQNNGYINQPYNMYQTLSREKQGKYHEYSFDGDDNYNKEDMNRPNMKTLGTNGYNVYHKFNGARPRFNDRQLMGRSGAGFDEEEYYEDYSDYTYQKLRQGKVDDYQGMMEDSGATFETEHYEGYQNQPNIHQKLLRTRQGYNRHELVEDIDRDRLKTYQNHPNDIHQKLVGVSQIYNHKEPMERDDTRILTEPHYEGPYESNIKSFERNANVRPKFEQELFERDRNSGLMGEHYSKENLHHPSNEHIHQKLLEPRSRFDQKELVERNDVRTQQLASPSLSSHTHEYDIRLDHQEFMESKGHANIEDHHVRHELNHPNIKYFDTNGHNIHKKLLETRPRFEHLEPIAASDKIKAEQHENGQNEPNTKTSEMIRNTYQKLTEAKPIFDHQDLKESKNNEMIEKVHINGQNNQYKKFLETGNPNIIETKGRSDHQNLIKDHSETFLDQFEETNEKIPVTNPIINEPLFEDLQKPIQEVIGPNTADIVVEHYNEDFHPNMKAQDINPNIYKNIPETARNGPNNMRNYAEPEHTEETNVIPIENTNTYPNSLENINVHATVQDIDIARSIQLDEKEKGTLGYIHPRLVQVPRIQPLVVLPRFGCRLVPICTRFYLRKRCPKTIIKCGLL